jgi:hypothetical protein
VSKTDNERRDRVDELKEEARLDDELEDTFPASDPPSIVQPAPPEPFGEPPPVQHVRRNPGWQDQLAGVMIVGGVLLLAGVLRR